MPAARAVVRIRVPAARKAAPAQMPVAWAARKAAPVQMQVAQEVRKGATRPLAPMLAAARTAARAAREVHLVAPPAGGLRNPRSACLLPLRAVRRRWVFQAQARACRAADKAASMAAARRAMLRRTDFLLHPAAHPRTKASSRDRAAAHPVRAHRPAAANPAASPATANLAANLAA